MLTLLADGPGWVAVDKPPGLTVIPPRQGGDCVRARLEAQLGRAVFVVHRLDRDTSGVLLFALDAATHRTLSMAFEAERVHKRYLALVAGCLREPRLVDAPLAEGRKGRVKVAPEGVRGKASRTRFRPLEVFRSATWLEALPATGRRHQLRVHLQHLGHPLVLDPLYGAEGPIRARDLGGQGDAVVLARTPLHAERAQFELGGAPCEVRAPLPADLEAALGLLRADAARGA